MKAGPILPSHILDKMSPEDRKELGKAGELPSEVAARLERKAERVLRKQCLSFCAKHGFCVGTARDDRRSTYTVGWPDLTIILPGRVIFVELKTAVGVLSDEQDVILKELTLAHQVATVIRSYEAFLSLMRHYLGRTIN